MAGTADDDDDASISVIRSQRPVMGVKVKRGKTPGITWFLGTGAHYCSGTIISAANTVKPPRTTYLTRWVANPLLVLINKLKPDKVELPLRNLSNRQTLLTPDLWQKPHWNLELPYVLSPPARSGFNLPRYSYYEHGLPRNPRAVSPCVLHVFM